MNKQMTTIGGALVAALVLSACQLVDRDDQQRPGDTPPATDALSRALQPQQSGTPRPEPAETDQEPMEDVAGRVQRAWRNLSTLESTAELTVSSETDTYGATGRFWFSKPNRFRLQLIEPAEGLGDEGTTVVFDGNTLWTYSPDRNQVTVVEGVPEVLFATRAGEPTVFPVLQIMQMSQFLEGLATSSEVRVVGDDRIGDRDVVLLEVDPRGQDEAYGIHRLWIDKETDLPVRVEMNRPDGTAFFELRFTELESNVAIPDELFTFQAPEQAEERRLDLDRFGEEMGWRGTTLEQARDEADFTLFAPTELPMGLEQRAVKTRSRDDRRSVVILYGQNEGYDAVLLQHAAQHHTPDLPGVHPMPMPGRQGAIAGVEGTTIMKWVQDGTRLTLISRLPAEQTVEMARSVRAVETGQPETEQ